MKFIKYENCVEFWKDDNGHTELIDKGDCNKLLGTIKIGKYDYPNTLFYNGLKSIFDNRGWGNCEFEYAGKKFYIYEGRDGDICLKQHYDDFERFLFNYSAGDILFVLKRTDEKKLVLTKKRIKEINDKLLL